MARPFTKRLGELERQSDAGSSVLLILEPGESTEQAASRHVAKRGPLLPGQQWLPIETGVPRGDDAWCA